MRRTAKTLRIQPNEQWAIEAAKQGDTAGLGALYEMHKNYVFNICLRMTRETASAEDLMQDIFLHLLRKIHLYKGTAAFRTWLHSVTVNMVLMHFRHSKRCVVSLENESTSFIAVEPFDDSSGDIDTRLSLSEALSCLPILRRRVLLLHDMEGYRHNEISQLLGIRTGASRCQLYQARSQVRRGNRLNAMRSCT